MQFPIWNPEALDFSKFGGSGKRAAERRGMDWRMYYQQDLYQLARTRYTWKNLPKTLSTFAIERALVDNGSVALYKHKDLDKPVMIYGSVVTTNLNGDAVDYSCYNGTANGNTATIYQKIIPNKLNANKDDCVIVLDNLDQWSQWYYIQLYSAKMADMRRRIECNIDTCITPLMASGNARDIKAVKDQINKALDGEAVIITDKRKKGEDDTPLLQTYTLNQEYYADKFASYLASLENEILNRFGVNTVGGDATDKKERLLSDEVNSNDDAVSKYLSEGLAMRRLAAKKINEKWNLDVQVDANITNSPINDPLQGREEDEENDDSTGLSDDKQ